MSRSRLLKRSLVENLFLDLLGEREITPRTPKKKGVERPKGLSLLLKRKTGFQKRKGTLTALREIKKTRSSKIPHLKLPPMRPGEKITEAKTRF